MRHFFRVFDLKDYLVFFLVTIGYLLLLLQSFPISNDDLTYIFHQSTDLPINSFSELIDSNIWGYLNVNGRFLVHCFVQACLNNYILFYIFSTFFFFLFLLSITYLIRRTSNRINGDIVYALIGILLFIPLLATLMYGTVAMTINYMWSAAIYLFFICVYVHIKNDNINYNYLRLFILFIFGLFCGSWQESFCIGIAGALCIYHIINIKHLTKSLFIILLGFGIGTATLVFAPGNFVRLAKEGSEWIGWGHFFYDYIQVLKHTGFIHIWWFIGLLSILIDFMKKRKFKFIIENWLFFLSAIIAFVFTTYTITTGSYQGKWQLTILGVWAVVLSVHFMQYYLYDYINKYSKYIIILFTLLTIGWYSLIYISRIEVKNEYDIFVEEFLLDKPDTIYDGKLQYIINNKIPNNEFLFEQVCPMYVNFYNIKVLNNLSFFYTKGEDKWGTYILPEPVEQIASYCNEDGVAYLTPLGYIVVRYKKDNDVNNKIMTVHCESKYLLDKLKDKLRNRNEYLMKNNINELISVSDDEYTYYIKYLNWWHYHSKNVVRVSIGNE